MSRHAFRYLPMALTRGRLPSCDAHPELDPDHHLWKNGRRWWIAFTVHTPDWKKRRLRFSLGTSDIHVARRRRDEVLERYQRSEDAELSLRYARYSA